MAMAMASSTAIQIPCTLLPCSPKAAFASVGLDIQCPFRFKPGNYQRCGGRREVMRKKRCKSWVGSTVLASGVVSIKHEWKEHADSYFAVDSRPIVLFDGVCNLCNGGVNFVLDNDYEGKLRLSALQSEAGKTLLKRSGRSPDDISSIVLVEKYGSYIKSEAVLRIAKYLNFPYPQMALSLSFFPLFIRDAIYDTIADSRYSFFGQTNTCRISDTRFAERFVSDLNLNQR